MKEQSDKATIGSTAPNFKLLDTVSGKIVSLDSIGSNKATMVMFLCNHCPYVKHANEGIVALTNDYKDKEISFIAISSNDINDYPEDSPEKMKEYAASRGYTFPYLYDETQEVAKAYGAVCTPDLFVYDKDLKLAYRGRLDDSNPGNDLPVTGSEIRLAIDAILAGEKPSEDQKPAIGCSIKWK